MQEIFDGDRNSVKRTGLRTSGDLSLCNLSLFKRTTNITLRICVISRIISLDMHRHMLDQFDRR